MRYLVQLVTGQVAGIELVDAEVGIYGVASVIAKLGAPYGGWVIDDDGGAFNLAHAVSVTPTEEEPITPAEGDQIGQLSATLAQRLAPLQWNHNMRFGQPGTALPQQRESPDNQGQRKTDPGA